MPRLKLDRGLKDYLPWLSDHPSIKLKIAGKHKHFGTYMPRLSIELRHKHVYASIVYRTEA